MKLLALFLAALLLIACVAGGRFTTSDTGSTVSTNVEATGADEGFNLLPQSNLLRTLKGDGGDKKGDDMKKGDNKQGGDMKKKGDMKQGEDWKKGDMKQGGDWKKGDTKKGGDMKKGDMGGKKGDMGGKKGP